MLDRSSVDKARVMYYALFSNFFIFKTQKEGLKNIDDTLAIIASNPLDSYTKDAALRILDAIDQQGTQTISDEYEVLFHSLNNKSINTTVSYYSEGIAFGKKCIQTKEFLSQTHIRKDEKNYNDPEDSFGFLMVFMYEIIKTILTNDDKYKKLQSNLFKEIINPYIDFFIEDIFNHKNSQIYKDVAILLNSFMEFERVYFETKKPIKQTRVKKEYGISDAEAKRRASNKAKKEADKLKNRT